MRGTRPVAPHDQRTQSVYIFGAICPAEGKAAGLILPFCNTTAMNLQLAELSQAVATDAHAVVLMDQAGWHTSDKLDLPANISILLLPPKSPELNPTENTWQFLRDNRLSNRVSNPPRTSSITAATPGTSLSINPGASCPSECAIGPTGSDQCRLV